MIDLSPIVLFVFKRPDHTLKTLEALEQNSLAKDSILFVFADGAKNNATNAELHDIEKVEKIVKSKKWCKEVIYTKRDRNYGLADNIVSGVTEVVNDYGKVIVLEDDIITSKGFLKYMNDALTIYQSEEKVMHISGYMFPVKGTLPETFFYRQTSCWGWATWKRAWKKYNNNGRILMAEAYALPYFREIDFDGTNQFVKQLENNLSGLIKTWAVKWQFSVFINNGLCLHPAISLVQNIGLDNSGENCGESNNFKIPQLATYVQVIKLPIRNYKKVYPLLKRFYKEINVQPFQLSKKLKEIIPKSIKENIKRRWKPGYIKLDNEIKRIEGLPRYVATTVNFNGKKLEILDIASFEFIKKELFENNIYKFTTTTDRPYIIDCGANIGLSIIYFKELFPNSEIVAFEPDDKIFLTLSTNLKTFGYSDIKLIKKALWNEETVLRFFSEGADGGRIASIENENVIEVKTVSLRPYLTKQVDFLKIDIEGAETVVLEDCKDLLQNVKKIFVEYHSFIDKPQELNVLIEILSKSGFRIYISSPGLTSANPFMKINTYSGMDMQLNIYGIRE